MHAGVCHPALFCIAVFASSAAPPCVHVAAARELFAAEGSWEGVEDPGAVQFVGAHVVVLQARDLHVFGPTSGGLVCKQCGPTCAEQAAADHALATFRPADHADGHGAGARLPAEETHEGGSSWSFKRRSLTRVCVLSQSLYHANSLDHAAAFEASAPSVSDWIGRRGMHVVSPTSRVAQGCECDSTHTCACHWMCDCGTPWLSCARTTPVMSTIVTALGARYMRHASLQCNACGAVLGYDGREDGIFMLTEAFGFEELQLRSLLQHMVSGQGSTVHTEFTVHSDMCTVSGRSFPASRDQVYQALYGYLRLLRLGNAPDCQHCSASSRVRGAHVHPSSSRALRSVSSVQGLAVTLDGVLYFGLAHRTDFEADKRRRAELPLTGL
jgi:hypothetical protein